jgi:hypothetical protein
MPLVELGILTVGEGLLVLVGVEMDQAPRAILDPQYAQGIQEFALCHASLGIEPLYVGARPLAKGEWVAPANRAS